MSELRFPMWRFYKGGLNRLVTFLFKWNLRRRVKNQKLVERLLPNYRLGCKRILISDNYYEAMNHPKYTLETAPIESLAKDAIKTADKEHKVDVIIYATGFELKENYDFIFNVSEL